MGTTPVCDICLDEKGQVAEMRFFCGCKGKFHEACVQQWWSEKPHVCPICKAEPRQKPKPLSSVVPGPAPTSKEDDAGMCCLFSCFLCPGIFAAIADCCR